jgi:hypothetical protein
LQQLRLDGVGDNTIKEVLDIQHSNDDQHLDALISALEVTQPEQIYILIDGLENATLSKAQFINHFQRFVENLHGKSFNVKVLLTGRPNEDLRVMLAQIPCIEYDKERKGLLFHSLVWFNLAKR